MSTDGFGDSMLPVLPLHRDGKGAWHRFPFFFTLLALIETNAVNDKRTYLRTQRGERAVNTVRELERRLGVDEALSLYAAMLGPNSIRLFLRVYADGREPDWERRQVKYSAEEIGRLSLFLPRVIEGISALDMLSVADILIYGNDGSVYLQPAKARRLYP